MLVNNSFIYHFHTHSKDGRRTYWRCEKRDIYKASCTTNRDVENGVNVVKEGNK